MQEKSIPELLAQFSEEIKRYLKLRSEYLRLSFGDRLVGLISGLVLRLVLLFLLLFLLFFASFAFVYWYGRQTGNYWIGCLITSGFYLILGVIIYAARIPLIYDQILKMYLKFSDLKEELEEEDENLNT